MNHVGPPLSKAVMFILTSTAALVGCGIEPLGITSVSITLSPVPSVGAPVGYSAEVLPLATGKVVAEPPSGVGAVRVQGLPTLPAGLVYRVWFGFTDGERGLFPGASVAAGAGHVHGALRVEDGVHAGSDDAGTTTVVAATGGSVTSVPVGDLVPGAGGTWSLPIAKNKLGKWSLETLRAAAVVLTATTDTIQSDRGRFNALTLLAGRAGASGPTYEPITPSSTTGSGSDGGMSDGGASIDASARDGEALDALPADGSSEDASANDVGSLDAGVGDAGGHVHGDQ